MLDRSHPRHKNAAMLKPAVAKEAEQQERRRKAKLQKPKNKER